MIKFLILFLLLFGACSTVSEEPFLNQVKDKTAFDTDQLTTQRGVFSSDGTEFRFAGGENVPLKIQKAIDDNTACYLQKYANIHIKSTFTINQNQLTIQTHNGQPPNTLYLN